MSSNGDGTPQVFEYVHFEGLNPDATSRKRVRSHAMKDYRRRQASASQHFALRQPEKPHDVQIRGSTRGKEDLVEMKVPARELVETSRFRFYTSPTSSESSDRASRQSSKKRFRDDQEEETQPQWLPPTQDAKLDLFAVPWAGGFDPFDTLPVASTNHVHKMLYHYVHAVPYIPFDSKNEWFNDAITNSALFKSILLISVTHQSLSYGSLATTECLRLRSETTQLLNERLTDLEFATSDNIIATVIYLACFEIILGNATAAQIHMKGAQQMVELRGGLRALGVQSRLQKLISWADICGSTLTLSAPRFPLIKTSNADRIPVSASMQVEMAGYMTSSKDLARTMGLNERQEGLVKIFQQMRQLSGFVSACSVSNKKALITSFSERVYMLERQLLLLSVSGDPLSASPMESFINGSCRSAAFIYIYVALREVPIGGHLYGTFIKRLRSALDHSGFMLAWSNTHPSTLLWVLVIGGMTATGRPERVWFVSQLAGVCVILKLQTLQDMKRILRDIAWVESLYDGLLKVLWTEVEVQLGSGITGKRKNRGEELALTL